jgi:acyl-CoA-binding protein
MASSGLAYPDRFYAAAAYSGLGVGSPDSAVISRFKSESALLLYALYQQATVGPCNVPKPRAWNPVEQTKWSSWNQLGDLSSAEAMRLFVKILERRYFDVLRGSWKFLLGTPTITPSFYFALFQCKHSSTGRRSQLVL